MSDQNVVARMDAVVDAFSKRNRLLNEPLTESRAKMFVYQHRQNTRFRNSVCKLKVATNCPEWDVKLGILEACHEEIVADDEFGGGLPHWQILENLGVDIGLDRDAIANSTLLPSTQIAWYAWETLCGERHWLEGLVANTCAERANIPGYGNGDVRDKGWFGAWRGIWGELFGLKEEQLHFFHMHSEADIKHSNLGWQTVATYAEKLHMEDQAVEACRVNLLVWDSYLNGIADGGDALERGDDPFA